MAVLANIGHRLYEFQDRQALTDARSLYAKFTGDQIQFETEMENIGIDFVIEVQE